MRSSRIIGTVVRKEIISAALEYIPIQTGQKEDFPSRLSWLLIHGTAIQSRYYQQVQVGQRWGCEFFLRSLSPPAFQMAVNHCTNLEEDDLPRG